MCVFSYTVTHTHTHMTSFLKAHRGCPASCAVSAGRCLFASKQQRAASYLSARSHSGWVMSTPEASRGGSLSTSRVSRWRPLQERSRSVYFSCITAGYKWPSQNSVPIQAGMVERGFSTGRKQAGTHDRWTRTHTHTKTEIK